MSLQKVRLKDLNLDWNLWPRRGAGKIDTTNVSRITESIKVGNKIPPIVVDAETKTIVDGVHRFHAYLKIYGEDYLIEVDMRSYPDKKTMFTEAMKLNAAHGLPLGPVDRTHCIIIGKTLGLTISEVAKALGVSDKTLEILERNRVALLANGDHMALTRGAEMLAESKIKAPLDVNQNIYAKMSDANHPTRHLNVLINALKSPKCIELTKWNRPRYIELYKLLKQLLYPTKVVKSTTKKPRRQK